MSRILAAVCIASVIFNGPTVRGQSQPWVSAYYAGWSQGWYNNGILPAQQIDYDAVTHIIHFGLVPHADGTVNSDANSIRTTNSDSLITAAHTRGKKVLICIGGWGTDREFRSATGLLTRGTFISNLVAFMQERGYDGIDIDWEVLELSDLAQYTAFIIELRARLDQITPRPLLTAVTSWQAPIFTLIHDKLDQINLMTYDLSGAWPGWVSWHNAPLFNGGYRFSSNGRLVPSADDMVEEFALAGIPKSKLGIGIDFYGYIWSGGSGTPTGGVTAPRQSWSSPPQIRSNVPYSALIQEQYGPEYYRWDSIAHASYLSIDRPGSSDDKFITYDNETTARKKMEYVKDKGIGGVIIWELGGGMLPGRYTNRDRLLKTIKKTMTAVTSPPTPPATISPVNFTRSVALRPNVRWEPSADASWYRVQIAYDSLFTIPVIDQRWIIDPEFTVGSLSLDTTYYWRVQSSDPFGESAWSPVSLFGTTADSLLPPSWQYISNTGENGTVVIPSTLVPKVGKRMLRNGDLIGVFFRRNGSLVCAGYSEWQEGQNITVTAWGDNPFTPGKDGFTAGDTIRFKFWERTYGIESNAVPLYASGGNTYTRDGIYILQTLTAPSDDRHILPMQAGWNMISSYVRPADPAISSVLNPILGNVVLMKDNRGNIFIPDSGINTIGTWNSQEGYQIFMRNADTLAVSGEVIVPETTAIPLTAGWNMKAYLRTAPLNPDAALVSIKENLLLVKDNDGKVYWPEYGIATLTQLLPGRGYKINVTKDDLLVYPPNDEEPSNNGPQRTAAFSTASPPMEHYPELKGTGNSAILLLSSRQFHEGDEVGAWSGRNTIIGTGKAQNGKCVIILWGKDPLLNEPEGAREGEMLRLTIWKKESRKEYRLMLSSLKDGFTQTAISPSLRYHPESVLIGSTTSVPFTHYLDQNYPNPFNPSTTISYGLSERTHVQVEVFNPAGQSIAMLVNGVQNAGMYSIVFKSSKAHRIASGVYFCRMSAGGFVSTKKMIMLK